MRVVLVPDDLGRRPLDADQVQQRPQVALGLGRRAAAERAARRHLGQLGRDRGFSNGNGSRNSSVAPPFLTYSVRLSICFWVSDEGWATSRTSRSAGIGTSGETELTSYCFFSSVTIDHSGFWPKLPHVEPAHQLGVGRQDAELLAAAPRDDADRAGQLVLDRQARGRRTGSRPPRGPR